jgi:hypothetical protein
MKKTKRCKNKKQLILSLGRQELVFRISSKKKKSSFFQSESYNKKKMQPKTPRTTSAGSGLSVLKNKLLKTSKLKARNFLNSKILKSLKKTFLLEI